MNVSDELMKKYKIILRKRLKKDSQNSTVLMHLVNHAEGITSLEAFRLYKITRLSARISDLRGLGAHINTEEAIKCDDGHAIYALEDADRAAVRRAIISNRVEDAYEKIANAPYEAGADPCEI